MSGRAPDLAVPIVGWRSWHVVKTDEGWRLSSIHYPELWPAGRELVADCHRGRFVSAAPGTDHSRHAAPGRRCLCGVYGARDLDHARQYFIACHSTYETVPAAPHYSHRVVGQVQLWGRVVECSQGYRAERAYPARLWVPTHRPDRRPFDVEAVAFDLLAYGAPVDLLDAASRYEIGRGLRREAA